MVKKLSKKNVSEFSGKLGNGVVLTLFYLGSKKKKEIYLLKDFDNPFYANGSDTEDRTVSLSTKIKQIE